jgi:hypothetical protein
MTQSAPAESNYGTMRESIASIGALGVVLGAGVAFVVSATLGGPIIGALLGGALGVVGGIAGKKVDSYRFSHKAKSKQEKPSPPG